MRIDSLELKIPPPVVAAVVAVAMWGVSLISPRLFPAADLIRVSVAMTVAFVGGCFAVAGGLSFRRAKTTANPMKPEAASSLVISGVYKMTRNPMYLGITLVLIAWALVLSAGWALLGPLAFVLYMGRFQIAPEERMLSALFGAEYVAYKSTVRRWL